MTRSRLPKAGKGVFISRSFPNASDGISEAEKQQIVWDVLRHYLGEDSQVVSLMLTYGTDEL